MTPIFINCDFDERIMVEAVDGRIYINLTDEKSTTSVFVEPRTIDRLIHALEVALLEIRRVDP